MASNRLRSPARPTDPTRKSESPTKIRTLHPCELVHFAGAVAQLFNGDSHPIQHGEQQVCHRRILADAKMTPTLHPSRSSTGQDKRKIHMIVGIAVADTGAVEQNGVVQECPIPVF